ncbi:MAG: hypothetical protein NTY30_04650 [Candidatus Berkelbacteria bacterium]|nr:hypothetical protein [Candidatus Berkelbacteria bacterium]
MKFDCKKLFQEDFVAMLAPSYVIDFPANKIVGMLKKLGFTNVVEVAKGVEMANNISMEYIRSHSSQKYFISSHCPTIVALVNNRFPELAEFLMPPRSPMVEMAKFCKIEFPKSKIVFISPCYAKKNLEAKNHSELIDDVITFSELAELFKEHSIDIETDFGFQRFDVEGESAGRKFAVSGRSDSAQYLKPMLKDEEILISSDIEEILHNLKLAVGGNLSYRFFDILSCRGGCVGGLAIVSRDLPVEQRIFKVEQNS